MKTPLFFAIANPSPAIVIALLASLALLAAGVVILRSDREIRRLRARLSDLEANETPFDRAVDLLAEGSDAEHSDEFDLPVPLEEAEQPASSDQDSFSHSPEAVALWTRNQP